MSNEMEPGQALLRLSIPSGIERRNFIRQLAEVCRNEEVTAKHVEAYFLVTPKYKEAAPNAADCILIADFLNNI